MTTMTLRINDQDSDLIKNYIQMHGLTISEFARQAMTTIYRFYVKPWQKMMVKEYLMKKL